MAGAGRVLPVNGAAAAALGSSAARLLIIDAMSLAYRAHFGFQRNPLFRPDGRETSALYGYCNTVFREIIRFKPTHVAACLDTSRATFRNDMNVTYKAGRPVTPHALTWQLKRLPDLSRALGINALAQPRFEADDLVGSLTRTAVQDPRFNEVLILSCDKDFLQLVQGGGRTQTHAASTQQQRNQDLEAVTATASHNTTTVSLRKITRGKFLTVDETVMRSMYGGIGPPQFVDYLALVGDAADNIKGCPGIGRRTAEKLLVEFGSLDALLQEAVIASEKYDDGAQQRLLKKKSDPKHSVLSPRLCAALLENQDELKHFKDLLTIVPDVPDLPALDELRWRGFAFNMPTAQTALEEFVFDTLMRKIARAAASEMMEAGEGAGLAV